MDYSDVTIMVVDDLPINIILIEKMLKRYNFNLISAHGGQEALDLMKTTRPALLLLDVMMPHPNGKEVLKIMRADEQLKDIRVIFFSALNDVADVQAGLEEGADGYITKPLTMQKLYETVDAQLEYLGLKHKE